jgi:adenylosuccinate lyase
MKHLFSPRMRVSTWRQLWIWLAESQKELGLSISDEAINQMKVNQIVQDDEFKIAAKEEERRRLVLFVLCDISKHDFRDVFGVKTT